jgi:hypothetical protein
MLGNAMLGVMKTSSFDYAVMIVLIALASVFFLPLVWLVLKLRRLSLGSKPTAPRDFVALLAKQQDHSS